MGTKKKKRKRLRHITNVSLKDELNSQKSKKSKMTTIRRMVVFLRQRWISGMRTDLSLLLDILMVKILMNN